VGGGAGRTGLPLVVFCAPSLRSYPSLVGFGEFLVILFLLSIKIFLLYQNYID